MDDASNSNSPPQPTDDVFRLLTTTTPRQVVDVRWHSRLERQIRIEIAIAADEPIIKRYFRHVQLPSNPILRISADDVQLNDDDLDRLADSRFDRRALHDGLVVLAVDEDEKAQRIMCGIVFGSIVAVDRQATRDEPSMLAQLSAQIDAQLATWKSERARLVYLLS